MRLRAHIALVPVLLCGAATLLCVLSATAGADVFGPISLVSEGALGGGTLQQAEYAHDPAISEDGKYVAFDGSIGGVTGVWRRDLDTGAIEQVAGGDAELPSISETGRYISFTSTEDLAPEDEPRGVNVWVRDMEPGPGEPEYILASAVNGSTKGLTYEYAEPEQEESERGAAATGRSAISADGQEVAFVTTAVSNLVAYPALEEEERKRGEVPRPHTPSLQVAVRYLRTEQTVLVSGTYDPADGQTTREPVSGKSSRASGAIYPGGTGYFRAPPEDGQWGTGPPPGASISADGSTVAWMGENIGLQARMLSAEDPSPLYTEPLWRRIALGSQTPTERVTGGSDPGNPACVASGESALPSLLAQSATDPCQGPFRVERTASNESTGIWAESDAGEADFVPRLSADGYTVAFVASAIPIALGTGFSSGGTAEPADLYVANMHSGLTRDQALTPVTELAGGGVAAADPITDFDISPDGEQVAFTTRRTEFPLGSPAYISAPTPVPGESELFAADLGDETLTRVTQGYEGGPSFQPHGSLLECGEDVYCSKDTEGAQSPSFSSEGEGIAFSSTASNLVLGDGNTPPAGPFDGSDAFLVKRQVFGALPTLQAISSPPEPSTKPEWRLGVTALSRSDGSVMLYVQAPGSGTLQAGAQSPVLVEPARGARNVRNAHPSVSHADKTEGKAEAEIAGARTVATSTVATRTVNANGSGLTILTLALASRYAALAGAHDGLSATVTVTFRAAGYPMLRDSIPVAFVRHIKRAKTRSRKKAQKVSSSSKGVRGK